jgi:hypothetical protein
MKRILLFTFSVMLACGLLATPTFAQVETTVFGPEQYSPRWGKPLVVREAFSTDAEATGSAILGTLVVETGQKNGLRWWKRRALGAEIRLNGCKILRYKDVNWKAPRIEVPVKLKKDNKLVIKIKGFPKSYITVKIDYKIGLTGPVFSGPQQYPFLCRTENAGLGQPLVDNQDGIGIAVYAEDENGVPIEDEIVGYCKDCSLPTQIDYFYRSTEGEFYRFDPAAPLPADLDTTTTSDGLTVDYIVRLERGTINRFIYGIAMLAPFDHTAKSCHPYFSKGKKYRSMWNTHAWNRKLVYQFQGGVAIGHQQADSWAASMINENEQFHRGPMNPDLLGKGYAVAFSTGTVTNTHYNMILSAETMMMVKEHFTASYGNPVYTVGVGGSGGSIQQYFIGQNYPGLLDAAIPQYSYSDMITQTIYVGDCSLMEFYFDAVAPALGDYTFGGINLNDLSWIGSVEPRTWIEGMSSNDEEYHPIYKNFGHKGSTSCVNGWLGLLPLCMNPLWTDTDELEKLPPDVVADVKWTHWNDLENVYGVDENGYTPVTWDNVGVQYGLQALKDGLITKEQFLTLNSVIGGWERPENMVQEGFPFYGDLEPDYSNFDPWSARNKLAPDPFNLGIAPRTEADLEAINAAYSSGHVFVGEIDIPVIDFRNYLDPELDMHHAMQSFATRQRMLNGQGHADNMLIWFADPGYDLTPYAFEILDEWLYNVRNDVHGEGVVTNKPVHAADLCVDAGGLEIGSGDNVWDGILNDNADGVCTQAFPLHSTSRIVAGGDIKGDVFKCFLQPVEEAIADGVYGDVVFNQSELFILGKIFEDGVCDYSQGDMGRP